jgi:hypothetical protein
MLATREAVASTGIDAGAEARRHSDQRRAGIDSRE